MWLEGRQGDVWAPRLRRGAGPVLPQSRRRHLRAGPAARGRGSLRHGSRGRRPRWGWRPRTFCGQRFAAESAPCRRRSGSRPPGTAELQLGSSPCFRRPRPGGRGGAFRRWPGPKRHGCRFGGHRRGWRRRPDRHPLFRRLPHAVPQRRRPALHRHLRRRRTRSGQPFVGGLGWRVFRLRQRWRSRSAGRQRARLPRR